MSVGVCANSDRDLRVSGKRRKIGGETKEGSSAEIVFFIVGEGMQPQLGIFATLESRRQRRSGRKKCRHKIRGAKDYSSPLKERNLVI